MPNTLITPICSNTELITRVQFKLGVLSNFSNSILEIAVLS